MITSLNVVALRTLCSNPDLQQPHFLRESLPQRLPIGSLQLPTGSSPLSLSSEMQKSKRQGGSFGYRGESEVASALSPSPPGPPDPLHGALLSENLQTKQQGPCLPLAKSRNGRTGSWCLSPRTTCTHTPPQKAGAPLPQLPLQLSLAFQRELSKTLPGRLECL